MRHIQNASLPDGSAMAIGRRETDFENICAGKTKKVAIGPPVFERGNSGWARDQGRCKRCRCDFFALDINVDTTVWKNFIWRIFCLFELPF
jgi:hypothetical protein